MGEFDEFCEKGLCAYVLRLFKIIQFVLYSCIPKKGRFYLSKIETGELVFHLNNWYQSIMRGEIKKAIGLKSEVDQLMPCADPDEQVILYCQLIESRYRILLESTENNSDSFMRAAGDSEVNGMLSFYYYLFNGVHEAFKSNNFRAIELFKIAEKKLGFIQDEIEIAEFHYRMGTTYYHMQSTFLSENHLEKAVEIYNKYDDYSRRQITCNIALGLNYIDQFRYDLAQETLLNCSEMSRSLGDDILFSISVFNLGYLHIKKDELKEAVKFIEKSLQSKELRENAPFAYLHGVYEAVRSYFKLGDSKAALKWLQLGFTLASERENGIFLLKFNTLHSLYVLGDNGKVRECVKRLEQNQAYVDVEAIALDIAEFYKQRKDFKTSIYFYDVLINAKKHILK